MSTHCEIFKQQDDGSLEGIYCHYDGYPEYTGTTLKQHYSDPDKVDQLLALGDLSVLGTEPKVGDNKGPQDHTFCETLTIPEDVIKGVNYPSMDDYTEHRDDDIEYAYCYLPEKQTWFLITKDGTLADIFITEPLFD